MAPRRPTAAQMRDRRARTAAIGLGVLFLIIAGIQGPKLLKMLSGGSSSSAASATTTTTAAGSTAAGAPVPFTSAAAPTTGQLNGFSLLGSKDPFHSQLPTTNAQTSTTPTTTTKQAATTKPAKQAAAKPTVPPPATSALPATTTTTAVQPTTGGINFASPPVVAPTGIPAAVVKMNGRRQVVAKGAGFPVAQPLFRIVTLGPKRVRIGLVTGSFADGSRTLMLRRGHKLTLLDTSDGSRFVFLFEQLTRAPLVTTTAGTTGAPQPSSAATTTPAKSTSAG